MKLKFLKITSFFVVILSFVGVTGCASTASSMLEKQKNTAQDVPDTYDYLAIAGKPERYITFHITNDGIYVDQENDTYNYNRFLEERKKYTGKGELDCLKITGIGNYALCDEKVVYSGSIFRAQKSSLPVNSLSGIIATAITAPFAVIGTAGCALSADAECVKKTWGVKNVIDYDSIYKVGGYVNAALYRDYKFKTDKILSVTNSDKITQAGEEIAEYIREFPNAEASVLLTEKFLLANINASSTEKLEQAMLQLGSTANQEGIKRVFSKTLANNDFKNSKYIYQEKLKGQLDNNDELISKYKKMALAQGTFDDAFEFVGAGDMESLKIAYDKASTDVEKRQIEKQLIWILKDKLVVFNTRMEGTGQTSSTGGSAITSMFGLGRKVGATVTSRIDYTGYMDSNIFKPKYDYRLKAKIRLEVYGNVNGWYPCGFMLWSKCEYNNKEETKVYEAPIGVNLTKQSGHKDSGATNITWNSVSGGAGISGGMLFGGTRLFQANGKIKVTVQNIEIQEIN